MLSTWGWVYRLTQSAKRQLFWPPNPLVRTIHEIFAHFNPQPDDQSLRLPEVIKGDDEGLLRGERDDRRAGKK